MKNEDVATTSIEQVTKKVPSVSFLGLAIGAMAVSATLMVLNRKSWANFVGQWAPTLLILGTYNKIVKTLDDSQQVERTGPTQLVTALKSVDELKHPSPLPLS
ncbi:hypothetical protein SAMN05444354_11930 [Stigmatella aurantiaca]|uniref:Uncharacterized protein n=1 Tax=Stigmatella aurantiaca TaxID=41 RepID=A0A1H7ZM96_STIAU|nr:MULTISPECIES: hypothetical protein [Stigmatella]SEM58668.1 hypothetical protein SAMN05444354_11930 [Stigmatella aurantiaca]